MGRCVVMGGALPCLVWGTVLVMDGGMVLQWIEFLLNNILMGDIEDFREGCHIIFNLQSGLA